MKMSGTLSLTHDRIGAPIVMFGTKLLWITRVSDSTRLIWCRLATRGDVPIHHVHVEPVRTASDHALAFGRKVGEIALGRVSRQ
jgi:hypothetical protein